MTNFRACGEHLKGFCDPDAVCPGFTPQACSALAGARGRKPASPVLPLPAAHRSMARGRMAANEVRSRGGDAMEAAIARLRATFDTASVHEDFKNRIRQVIERGTGHPAVRARYVARAVMLCGRSLDAAIFDVERWYCAERRAYQLASTYGFARGRLSLQVARGNAGDAPSAPPQRLSPPLPGDRLFAARGM